MLESKIHDVPTIGNDVTWSDSANGQDNRLSLIGPGAYPASYTMGTGSFPGLKRPGRGVDHLRLVTM